MLHRLEIENFYSIADRQIVDLRVAANVPAYPSRFGPAWQDSSERVPKVVTIFGPNASGKSNVLRALSFMAQFIQNSFSLPAAPDPLPGMPITGAQFCESFFSDAAATKPTRLCVWFAGPSDLSQTLHGRSDQCRYAYEVSFSNTYGKPKNILHEALFFWPSGSRRRLMFERNATGQIKSDKSFALESGYKPVRSNVSAIAWLAQFDHAPSTMIQRISSLVFSNILLQRNEAPENIVYGLYASRPDLLEVLNRDIDRLDLGLKGMRIILGPNGPSAEFDHEGLNRPLPPSMESHGTRQFISIFPLIMLTLAQGGVAVIDELDSSIHPLLLPEIIRWFHDPMRNPHDAQLWTTCHNAAVLDHLEKEEIIFCQKDGSGRTSVYALQDIKSKRRDDNYHKKYLGGVYGAVPHIG